MWVRHIRVEMCRMAWLYYGNWPLFDPRMVMVASGFVRWFVIFSLLILATVIVLEAKIRTSERASFFSERSTNCSVRCDRRVQRHSLLFLFCPGREVSLDWN